MTQLIRKLFRPTLLELERRDVPAWWSVAVPTPAEGTLGSTAATLTGGLGINPGQIVHNGTVQVFAPTALDAVTEALSGTISVLFEGVTVDHEFGPNTVGEVTDHEAFAVSVSGSDVVILMEDMADFPDVIPDWDYNDHTWDATIGGASAPDIYDGQFTWTGSSGSGTVTVNVTAIDGDTYKWNYHVFNDSFEFVQGDHSFGMGHFTIGLPDLDVVESSGNTVGAVMGLVDGGGTGGDEINWAWGGEDENGDTGMMPGDEGDFWYTTDALPVDESEGDFTDTEDTVSGGGGCVAPGPKIEIVTWENTGTATGGPLDDQPAATPGGGQRIFAERKAFGDAAVADEVTIQVQLTAAVAGVPIKCYIYDVDDPSSNQGPVDDETKPSDNRAGNVGVGGFNGVSDANGRLSVVVKVSHQPGDNYRVVATVNTIDLFTAVKAKQNDGVNAGVYFAAGGAAVADSKAATVTSRLLTVWRHLHIEQDRMKAPGPNDGPFDGAGVENTEIGKDDVDPNGPIPDPPLNHLTDSMRVAYVETVADLAALNKNRDWTFVHNINDIDMVIGGNGSNDMPKGMRDVPSDNNFWTVQIVGAYEYKWPYDGDRPLSPTNPTFSWTRGGSFGGADGNPGAVLIFTETIRDSAAFNNKYFPNAKSEATMLKRNVTHEVGHRFKAPHGDVGIMAEGGGAFLDDALAVFYPVTINRIREINKPT